MRPTTAYDNVFDFEALLHPGTVFETPGDVLKVPTLTLSEKRAILGVGRISYRVLPRPSIAAWIEDPGDHRRRARGFAGSG